MSNSLFLRDAMDARRQRPLSRITLRTPVPLKIYTIVACVIASAIVAFVISASYTKRSTVVGTLVPSAGAIRLVAHQAGVITQKRATEGQFVRKGEVLLVVSADRSSQGGEAVLASITDEARIRERAFRAEIRSAEQQYRERAPLLRARLAALRAEQPKLDEMIASARQRLEISRQTQSRFEELRDSGFATLLTLDQAKVTSFEAQTQLSNIERDRLRLRSQIIEMEAEAANTPYDQAARVAQLRRSLSQAAQDVSESEARNTEVIRAPMSGFVTGITGTVGQFVEPSKPLGTLLPQHSTLEAHLYATSRAIGFVKPGSEVNLRYQAFPYQKFGQPRGRVVSISRVAFPASELPGADALGPQALATGARVYVVRVMIPAQSIKAYGRLERLQAGMSLEADMLLDRRRLYEWMLEPLMTITGRVDA